MLDGWSCSFDSNKNNGLSQHFAVKNLQSLGNLRWKIETSLADRCTNDDYNILRLRESFINMVYDGLCLGLGMSTFLQIACVLWMITSSQRGHNRRSWPPTNRSTWAPRVESADSSQFGIRCIDPDPLVMTNSLLLKMAHRKSLIYPLKGMIFHCYVSLPEGTCFWKTLSTNDTSKHERLVNSAVRKLQSPFLCLGGLAPR